MKAEPIKKVKTFKELCENLKKEQVVETENCMDLNEIWESISSLVYVLVFALGWYFYGFILAIAIVVAAMLGEVLIRVSIPYIKMSFSYCKEKTLNAYDWCKSKVSSKEDAKPVVTNATA